MHCHHNHNEPADWQTVLGTLGEGANNALNFYFVGNVFDTLTQSKTNDYGISDWGTVVGAFVASISAPGAAYCHCKYNHQRQGESCTSDPPYPQKLASESKLDIRTDQQSCMSVDDITPPSPRNELSLTPFKYGVLGLDAIVHTFETAAPLCYAYDVATFRANLPKYAKPLFQLLSIGLGSAASVAPVNTCKNTLLGIPAAVTERGNNWSRCTLLIEAFTNIISNSAWVAEFLNAIIACINDDESAQSALEMLDFSQWDAELSLGIGAPTALIAAYIHYVVNVRNQQGNSNYAATPRVKKSMSTGDMIKYFGGYIGERFTDIADKATCPVLATKIAMRNRPLSPFANLGLHAGALFFGAITSKADTRGYMKDFKESLAIEERQIVSSHEETHIDPVVTSRKVSYAQLRHSNVELGEKLLGGDDELTLMSDEGLSLTPRRTA